MNSKKMSFFIVLISITSLKLMAQEAPKMKPMSGAVEQVAAPEIAPAADLATATPAPAYPTSPEPVPPVNVQPMPVKTEEAVMPMPEQTTEQTPPAIETQPVKPEEAIKPADVPAPEYICPAEGDKDEMGDNEMVEDEEATEE